VLTLDVQNILDEKLKEFYDNNPNEPARIYKNGRLFFVGARAKF
jgi:iron complex outermembrane receptor protein